MVCIQIVSDLHLKGPQAYDIFDIPPRAPYLALLGDIGYAVVHEAEYHAFLRRQLRLFRVVFLVLGNHEPWGSNWDHARTRMRDFEREIRRERGPCEVGAKAEGEGELGEFVLLDQTRFDFPVLENGWGEDEVTVLGCTLFSRVPPHQADSISLRVQDFYKIVDWTVPDHTQRFEEDLAWPNGQVAAFEADGDSSKNGNEKRKRKFVILTHHSPTLHHHAVDPRHRNSPIQAGFATDLESELCFRSSRVTFWAFGHTHFNCDYEV
ncbi:Ser/Thr protein phosphatase superfamily [Xylaria cf. heliscus]|nr:Ser/Thr protein phosphatase superfamily [Xylaria cf. heliscus]